MLHHGKHQPASVYVRVFVSVSVFIYECACTWTQIQSVANDVALVDQAPLSLFISPKAFLLDNSMCICVYDCKCVNVYQPEVELIRALGISLSSHSFPARPVPPKMDIELWGFDPITSPAALQVPVAVLGTRALYCFRKKALPKTHASVVPKVFQKPRVCCVLLQIRIYVATSAGVCSHTGIHLHSWTCCDPKLQWWLKEKRKLRGMISL